MVYEETQTGILMANPLSNITIIPSNHFIASSKHWNIQKNVHISVMFCSLFHSSFVAFSVVEIDHQEVKENSKQCEAGGRAWSHAGFDRLVWDGIQTLL